MACFGHTHIPNCFLQVLCSGLCSCWSTGEYRSSHFFQHSISQHKCYRVLIPTYGYPERDSPGELLSLIPWGVLYQAAQMMGWRAVLLSLAAGGSCSIYWLSYQCHLPPSSLRDHCDLQPQQNKMVTRSSH